MYTRKWPTTNT